MTTIYIILEAVWTVFHSFLYGFHISALNGVQENVMCEEGGSPFRRWGIKSCVPLTPGQFGIVATIFTLGGLLGSLGGSFVTQRFGRVGSLRIAEMGFMLGAAAVGLANAMWLMVIGRIIIGISSGLTMVTVPLYLSEIAPKRYRTKFGILHQIWIGLGMITAQTLSIPFSKAFIWRYSLLVGVGFGGILLLGSFGMRGPSESRKESSDAVEGGEDEQTPLVSKVPEKPLSVRELFQTKNSHIRRGLLVAVVAQLSQQICGISPVMYFSTRILSSVFSTQSRYVVLFIMAIGIPFNFVPGLLPESFGSKRLLLVSSFGTATSCILLAIGLNKHLQSLSGIGVIAFVLSFSIGLAPMVWVVLSEVLPANARTAGSSVGVSVNWLTNFTMGSIFLPLQEALKTGETQGEGNVFFFFAACSALAFFSIWTAFRLYDKVES